METHDNNEKAKEIVNKFIEVKENNDNIIMDNGDERYNELGLKIEEFEDDRERKKFINKIKMFVRRSPEYSVWVNYIKYVLQKNECVLSNEHISQVSIDLHHHPISLQNIVEAIINKYIHNGVPFTSFQIANEVLVEHYQDTIGYVTLVNSLHEKFHRGFLEISINDVSGDWRQFLKKYDAYIDDEDKEVINKYMSVMKSSNYYKIGNGDLNE